MNVPAGVTTTVTIDYSRAHNCPDIAHRVSLCVYIVIVSFLNIFLFYLIRHKTINAMKDYKIILYTTTVIDFASAWSQFLIGITFNFDGFLPYWVQDWPMFAGGKLQWLALIETFTADFSFAFGVMPFIYRYFAVCWDWKLRVWQFVLLTSCTAWFAVWSSGSYAWMSVVFYEQNVVGVFQDPKCVRALPSWTAAQSESDLNPAFFYWMFRGWSYGLWGILYSYAALFFCGWRIYKKVEAEAFVFESKKARAAQRQLTLTIGLQALTPMLVTGCSLCFLYLGIKAEFHKGLSFVVLFYSFMVFPVLNPIISLTFISSYRKPFLAFISWLFGIRPRRVGPLGQTTTVSSSNKH